MKNRRVPISPSYPSLLQGSLVQGSFLRRALLRDVSLAILLPLGSALLLACSPALPVGERPTSEGKSLGKVAGVVSEVTRVEQASIQTRKNAEIILSELKQTQELLKKAEAALAEAKSARALCESAERRVAKMKPKIIYVKPVETPTPEPTIAPDFSPSDAPGGVYVPKNYPGRAQTPAASVERSPGETGGGAPVVKEEGELPSSAAPAH